MKIHPAFVIERALGRLANNEKEKLRFDAEELFVNFEPSEWMNILQAAAEHMPAGRTRDKLRDFLEETDETGIGTN